MQVSSAPVPEAKSAGWQARAPASEILPPPPALPSFQGSCGARPSPGRSPEAGYYAPSPVQQVVGRLRGRWKDCYTKGLARDPTLAGKVVVRVEVNEEGRVCQAAAQETTLRDPEVVACVVRSFLAAQFPSHTSDVTFVYPVVFSPGN